MLIAARRIFRQALPDDALELRRRVRLDLGQRARLVVQDVRDRLGRTAPGERAFPGGHLVQDAAQRENIGAPIHGQAGRLFGREVARRPHHHPRHRAERRRRVGVDGARAARFDQLGDAEVEHLRAAVGRHHDVLGLDVAVDDARLMRGRKGAGDVRGDRQPLGDGAVVAFGQSCAQRGAIEVLLDDVPRVAVDADVVHRGDMRMIQRGGRTGLLFETREPLGVGRELRRQHLDRHLAAETGVHGLVHLAHPTRADRRADFIGAQFHARRQAHQVTGL